MVTEEFWQFPKLLYEKDAGGHRNTAHSNIRTLPFTSSGTLPKYIQQPSFHSVDCNLAAYIYWYLYPILGIQPPGQK